MLNSTDFNLLESHVIHSCNSFIWSLHGALHGSAFIIYLFPRLNSSSLFCSLWRGWWYICSKDSRKYLSGVLIVNGRLDQNSAVLIICCVCAQALSCIWLFATPWTVAYQAPLSIGFFRQEYWSGFPLPSPQDLPDLGIEPDLLSFLHWQADSLATEPPGKP